MPQKAIKIWNKVKHVYTIYSRVMLKFIGMKANVQRFLRLWIRPLFRARSPVVIIIYYHRLFWTNQWRQAGSSERNVGAAPPEATSLGPASRKHPICRTSFPHLVCRATADYHLFPCSPCAWLAALLMKNGKNDSWVALMRSIRI